MSLEFTYDGSAFAGTIKPSTVSVPTRAENGDTGNGVVPFEDMAGTVEIVGHRPFIVEESLSTAPSQPRLFTGWTVERDYARQGEGGLIVEASRLAEINIVDANAAAGFRIIWDEDGNRPEETWNDRLAWIVGSDYLGPLIGGDTTFFGSYTQTMDAADYRGSTAGSVLDDLRERTGGVLNWFIFWNPDTSDIELFIKREQYTIGQCTLSISNVESEVDGITTFAPDNVAKLAREPDQTYSEVIVEYNGGKVYRKLDATATTFIQRGTTISRPYTKRESTAISQADQWLKAHAVERDRITCTMRSVPASLVGLVQAGMGIDVKFPHFDVEGYADAPVTMRIVMCSPVPVSDLGDLYDIALELVGGLPEPPVEEAAQIALCYSDTGCTTQAYPRVVMYDTLGDTPPSGWDPYATIGEVEALGCSNYQSDPGYYGIQVNGSGTVNVEHYGGYAGVSSYGDTITWAIRKNGVVIESGSWTDPVAGWGHAQSATTYLLASNVTVETGDVFDTYVTVSGSAGWLNVYYRKVGVPWNPSLKLWGTLTTDPVPVIEGDPIPTPTHPTTTTSTVDPTVDDDVSHGFQVGDLWINTTDGSQWVLVDSGTGFAVWVSTTYVSLWNFSTSDGVTTVDPTTELTFVGGTLADLGGGVAELTLGGPGGSLPWYDVTVDGACVGDGTTDDTAALQAAIDAATASGTQSATLYFPPGTYLIGGALQDTGAFNGQILLPDVSTSDPQVTIRFLGAARPPFAWHGDTPAPGGYSIIQSTLTGGSGTAAVISAGNGALPTQNNVSVIVENLMCIATDNPTFTFCNLLCAQGGAVRDVQITTAGALAGSGVEPTHSNAYGMKLPQPYNSNYTFVDGLSVGYFYTGVLQGELATCRGLILGPCVVGMELGGSIHASLVVDMQVSGCAYGIRPTGLHYCDILQYDSEHYNGVAFDAWMRAIYDLDDSSDYFHGDIRWFDIGATAFGPGGWTIDHVFNVNGGANATYSEIGAAVGAPTTVDYLVGTASGALSAEIVVGTTPGGELGGTWASPTVDATHSGSAHLALGTTSSTAAAGDHTHAGTSGGELLITDTPAGSPLIFADILQNEDGTDLLYSG